jgi:hypothetical protein
MSYIQKPRHKPRTSSPVSHEASSKIKKIPTVISLKTPRQTISAPSASFPPGRPALSFAHRDSYTRTCIPKVERKRWIVSFGLFYFSDIDFEK